MSRAASRLSSADTRARGRTAQQLLPEPEGKLAELTPRAMEIFESVAHGLPNRETATELVVEDSPSAHVKWILDEAGAPCAKRG